MKKFILFFTLIFIYDSYSQTAQIKNVFVNNVPIPQGGSIDFGNNSSIVVRFTSEFTKPNNLTIGQVQHSIGTYSGSGNYTPLITPEFFTLGVGNSGFSGVWEKTLYASDYSYTGGNYLASRVEQTQGNNGNPPIIWDSNQIVINRSPVFTLNPTSLSLNCGDISSKTFTVASNSLPVGSLTYQWSHSGGWSGTSTSSSITLTPTSGLNLPGTVTVTPILNGVSQNQLSCTISRAAFSSGASVSGPTGICTGSSNYTLANLPAGQNVAWSLSNPALASLSSQTNAGVTVNFTGIGAQTLSATITNACGQNSVVPFVINTTSSTFSSPATISGNQNVCFGSANYTISNVQAGHNVAWSLSNPAAASLSNQTNSGVTVTSNVSGPQTLTATITNTCNQTSVKTRTLYIGKPGSLNSKSSISGPTSVASGALATYSINSALPQGATSFEWWLPYPYETVSNFNYFGQNWQKLTSSAGSSISVFTGLGQINGYVQVMGKNQCGCGGAKFIYVSHGGSGGNIPRMSGPNSANETNAQNHVTIFPNPSSGLVNIELNQTNNEKLTGELFDLLGKSILKVDIIDNKGNFSVGGLTKGIYYLKIYTIEGIKSQKILVE
jgi:hypothetical protein